MSKETQKSNVHTLEELQQLQSYPLFIKESITADRIRDLAKEHEFYVSFSGGKDSEVAVDLTAKTLKKLGYKRMYVLNIRTGLEYMSVMEFCKPFCEYVSKKYDIEVILDTVAPETPFKEVLTTFGYPVISKEVSQNIYQARQGIENGDGTYQYSLDKLNGVHKDKNGDLSQYNIAQYKFLIESPFRISHICCNKVKKEPAIFYERKTGRIPLIATTAEESRLRKTKWLLHGCNAFDLKRPTSAPFSFWTNQDMLEYIHREELPIAAAYGKVVPENNTGIEGQIDMFDIIGYEGCKFCTTGCPRTGCAYCLFGITADLDRILRLQELEPKKADFVLRGGQFDEEGMWIPSEDGLGYWFILDYLAEHGIEIPYANKEKFRRKL